MFLVSKSPSWIFFKNRIDFFFSWGSFANDVRQEELLIEYMAFVLGCLEEKLFIFPFNVIELLYIIAKTAWEKFNAAYQCEH